MTQLFANNAVSTLSSNINATVTSLDVAASGGANFPSPSGGDYFLLTLIGLGSTGQEETWEIVKVTGRSSDTLTITRGQEGTTALSWLAGVRVELRMTADTVARAQELVTDATPQLSGNLDGQTYDISTTGDVTGANLNVANWNTAYGWGDHSTESYATETYVGTQVSNLVDSSPATLDTLNELAAALGDDANFAATMTTSLGTKAPLASPAFTGSVTLGGDNIGTQSVVTTAPTSASGFANGHVWYVVS
jgi:hypothetical protein